MFSFTIKGKCGTLFKQWLLTIMAFPLFISQPTSSYSLLWLVLEHFSFLTNLSLNIFHHIRTTFISFLPPAECENLTLFPITCSFDHASWHPRPWSACLPSTPWETATATAFYLTQPTQTRSQRKEENLNANKI